MSPLIFDDLPCPECHDEKGKVEHCEACWRRGKLMFKSCPMAEVTPDVWTALRLAGFAERGTWPVAGGVMDQAAGFVRLVEYVRTVDPAPEARPELMMAQLLQSLTR